MEKIKGGVKKTPHFWESAQQANERLTGCFILHGDDPVYVLECYNSGGEPHARIQDNFFKNEREVPLASEEFHRFRKLPPLGWTNIKGSMMATYTERTVVRTRSHGLTYNNVATSTFHPVGDNYDVYGGRTGFKNVHPTTGWLESVKGVFPSLDEILERIIPSSAIAYSRAYCVFMDKLGIRWLYRDKERIGMFTGNDTLNLFEKTSFFKDEIMEDEKFTLNNIKEF